MADTTRAPFPLALLPELEHRQKFETGHLDSRGTAGGLSGVLRVHLIAACRGAHIVSMRAWLKVIHIPWVAARS